MKDSGRTAEVSVGILSVLGTAAIGMGVYRASDHHDAALWWASAACCFVLMVLVPVAYFAIHPLFVGHRRKAQEITIPKPEELPAGKRPGSDLLQPSELRDYLRQIKQTMDEEGFGSMPTSERRSEPQTDGDDVQEVRRSSLLRRGHDLLTGLALNLPADADLPDSTPAILSFVSDGQEFVSQHLPQRARPELLFRYPNVRDAQHAIEETLGAVRNVGHFAEPNVAVDHGRIVRANVQAVLDEIAWARRVINEGLDEQGFWWDRSYSWQTWENVKGSLGGEPGFHAAYNATRDAWDSLQRAEQERLNYDPVNDIRRGEFTPGQARIIDTALERSAEAEKLLFNFLANYD